MQTTYQFIKMKIFIIGCIALLGGLMSCGQEQSSEQSQTSDANQNVKVNWTWKRTVKGETNVIYGTVENKGDKDLKQITLEFRTKNIDGTVLFSTDFTIDDVPKGTQKPFTKDYPAQATHEDSAFVTVKKVLPID